MFGNVRASHLCPPRGVVNRVTDETAPVTDLRCSSFNSMRSAGLLRHLLSIFVWTGHLVPSWGSDEKSRELVGKSVNRPRTQISFRD